MPPLPRIESVTAMEPPHGLRIVWQDGRTTDVDMSGAVNRIGAFAPLRDAAMFRRLAVVDHGHGIEWPGGLDFSATSLDFLAREQAPFTAGDFAAWQETLRLSNREAADLLDASVSTVKNYRSGHPIPKPVTMACRATLRDPALAMAHLRPRFAGRPTKGRENTHRCRDEKDGKRITTRTHVAG